MKYGLVVCMLAGASLMPAWAAPSRVLPPPSDKVIDFARDIKPLIDEHCIKCHGERKQKSLYRMDNRADTIGSGSEKSAIIPGNSAESLVIILMSAIDPGYEPMPPKGDLLTPEEVGLFRAWIDQGVKWSAPVDPAVARVEGLPFDGLGGTWRMGTTAEDALPADWKRSDAPGPVGELCVQSPAPVAEFAGHGNLLWDDGATFGRGTLSARFVPSDEGDPFGGGLVWQVRDGQNYLLALYRGADRQLALYRVRDGAMDTLGEAELPSMKNSWLDLEVTQAADRVAVRADGEVRIEAPIPAEGKPSGAGLFTPAEATARITVPRVEPD